MSSEILREEYKIFWRASKNLVGTGHPTASARHCCLQKGCTNCGPNPPENVFLDPAFGASLKKDKIFLVNDSDFVKELKRPGIIHNNCRPYFLLIFESFNS